MGSNPGHESKPKKASADKGKILQFRANTPAVSECFWSVVDAKLLLEAVDNATRQGAALILGVTSDGGAFSICVLDKDGKAKEYPHGKAECENTLRQIADYYA